MLDQATQIAVIRGLRDGNRSDWTTLYDGYSVDVWRYVARLLGPDATAVCDVVQETFLAAAGSARNFDPERGTLWNWLSGIAHHQVAKHWRQVARMQRLRELAESGASELRRWLDDAESITAESSRQDLSDLVRGVLAEMSADNAMLLVTKYLDERSLEEIAIDNGSSLDAVKSKLARARREFRMKFEHLTREPTPTLKK